MRKILIILTVLLATVTLNAKDMIKLKFNKCFVLVDNDTTGTVVKAEFDVFISDDYMKVRCPEHYDLTILNHNFEVLQLEFKQGTNFYVEFLNHGFEGVAEYQYEKLFVTFGIGKSSYSYIYSN